MRPLKNHVIIYDDECPMCNLYTGAFIRAKMLDKNGRECFSQLSNHHKMLLDQSKACDEIALIDVETKKVFYGIDSLFQVISHSFPVFKPLFSFSPFRLVMTKLYAFISYNRKVIAPGKVFEAENSCTPTFNAKYRWLYIVFAWLVTSLILNSFSSLLEPSLVKSNFYREFLICGGQVVFQTITISLLRKERLLHYLGNMMTISLAGSLLLLPALVFSKLELISSPYFYTGWFLLVVALMLLEHMRRVKMLGIHWSATLSWVLYRTIILTIILCVK
jgi:predicted DCC family thiol-disulfide oxidoreductase YuxK